MIENLSLPFSQITSGPNALITFFEGPICSILASSPSFAHNNTISFMLVSEGVYVSLQKKLRVLQFWEHLLSGNWRTGATITNRHPSLALPNLKSISVPPRFAIDTRTCYADQKDR